MESFLDLAHALWYDYTFASEDSHRGSGVHHAFISMSRYQCSHLLFFSLSECYVSVPACCYLPRSLCGGDSADCQIGNRSTALICENCPQLFAPSASYSLDSVSASSIPWIRVVLCT